MLKCASWRCVHACGVHVFCRRSVAHRHQSMDSCSAARKKININVFKEVIVLLSAGDETFDLTVFLQVFVPRVRIKLRRKKGF